MPMVCLFPAGLDVLAGHDSCYGNREVATGTRLRQSHRARQTLAQSHFFLLPRQQAIQKRFTRR